MSGGEDTPPDQPGGGGGGDPTPVTGGCGCGAVRFAAPAAPARVGLCHCLDCRHALGAPFWAAAVYPAAAVTVTGETVSHAGWHFCAACHAPVFAISDTEIELHLGSLDRPGTFTPQYELWTIRREPWLAPVPGARQYARNADAPGDR